MQEACVSLLLGGLFVKLCAWLHSGLDLGLCPSFVISLLWLQFHGQFKMRTARIWF